MAPAVKTSLPSATVSPEMETVSTGEYPDNHGGVDVRRESCELLGPS
jgi:hypothetical protein